MKSLLPFSIPKENSVNCCNETTNTESEEIKEIEDALSPDSNTCTQNGDLLDGEAQFDCDFEFYLADEQGNVRGPQIAMDEPVNAKAMTGLLSVIVHWADKMVEEYSQQLNCSLPEVFKSGYLMKRPQESVSLYKCLEAFLKEEPLGPEDMWLVC